MVYAVLPEEEGHIGAELKAHVFYVSMSQRLDTLSAWGNGNLPMTDEMSDSDCLLIAIEGVLRSVVPANPNKVSHPSVSPLMSVKTIGTERQLVTGMREKQADI